MRTTNTCAMCAVVLFSDTNKDHVVRTASVVVLFTDTNKDHVVRTATCGCVVL